MTIAEFFAMVEAFLLSAPEWPAWVLIIPAALLAAFVGWVGVLFWRVFW